MTDMTQLERSPANLALSPLFLLALALVSASASPAVAQQSATGFSADEAARLAGGELIRRDLPGSGHAFGGVSFQRVRAPIETVWAKARDPEALTDLIPTLDRARVVEDHGDSRVIYMHHSYPVGETEYYLRMAFDDQRRELTFEVDVSRPHDVQGGRGFMRLTSFHDDTIVTWGMRLDPGANVVIDLFGPMLTGWLLKPPVCMRDAVEPGREPSC